MAGEPLDHRLIMFVGSPGAGKSTLSRWLYQQLVQRGLPAALLPEHEVYQLDAIQAFTAEWNHSHPAGVGTLLDAIRTLCVEWNASNTVWITDQFLPAFHWLQGKYPPESVQAYAEALAQILHPLSSLLVYLEAEVHEAWRRTVDERGQTWSDWMVDLFASRDFPQYPGGPLQDLDDLLRFFEWEQSQSLALLAHWPWKTLIFRATATPLDHLQDALLQQVELNELPDSSHEER